MEHIIEDKMKDIKHHPLTKEQPMLRIIYTENGGNYETWGDVSELKTETDRHKNVSKTPLMVYVETMPRLGWIFMGKCMDYYPYKGGFIYISCTVKMETINTL
jgi:hypothetical protein